ncbi:MAG: HPr(Ser) kinase/phosphatase [Candidatus Aminicenantes bacterium]|nr:HPr(Ser) kinase/phosphatase [Candidatus Aminicenantes bacterium]
MQNQSVPPVTVRQFYESMDPALNLALASSGAGLDNSISSPRIQKLGLALSGYTRYLHRGRVQFVGRTEIYYMEELSPERRRKVFADAFDVGLCCILVTTGLAPPPDFLAEAERAATPVLTTTALSSQAIVEVTTNLQEHLALTRTIHGVLVELLGLGVLLVGESGIGKSECALDLILRGHRLVSDDLVVLKRVSGDSLVGSGLPDAPFHMELRGLGIINVRDLFGISVLSSARPVDLVIKLEKWPERDTRDRLGLEEEKYRVLGVDLPLITIPVAPGRTLATLVEVAVRIQKLKMQGYNPALESIRLLERRIQVPWGQGEQPRAGDGDNE